MSCFALFMKVPKTIALTSIVFCFFSRISRTTAGVYISFIQSCTHIYIVTKIHSIVYMISDFTIVCNACLTYFYKILSNPDIWKCIKKLDFYQTLEMSMNK